MIYYGDFGGSLVSTSTAANSLASPTVATFLSLQPGAVSVAFDDVVFYSRKLSLAEANQLFLSDAQ